MSAPRLTPAQKAMCCECGHLGSDHQDALPSACEHGRSNPEAMGPGDPGYGCPCIGFRPEKRAKMVPKVVSRDALPADLRAAIEQDRRERSAPGLVTELVDALREAGDDLGDMYGADGETCDCGRFEDTGSCWHVKARKALARATPEAVRKADAAPDLAVALRADWNGLRAIAATLRAPEGRAQEAAVRELRRLIDQSAEALALAGERP